MPVNYFHKILILLIILTSIFLALFLVFTKNKNGASQEIAVETNNLPAENNVDLDSDKNTPINNTAVGNFAPPLKNAGQRITKKKFGDFITPQNSPVQPEKFSGYHTGVDFEILPGEENIEIPALAVCTGKLIYKNYVSGYGGVAIQECLLDNSPITVLYGHLKLSSLNSETGNEIKSGNRIGILGAGFSSETDGERKHLHLTFYKGFSIELRGYVQNKSNLNEWLNPCDYGVCQ